MCDFVDVIIYRIPRAQLAADGGASEQRIGAGSTAQGPVMMSAILRDLGLPRFTDLLEDNGFFSADDVVNAGYPSLG